MAIPSTLTPTPEPAQPRPFPVVEVASDVAPTARIHPGSPACDSYLVESTEQRNAQRRIGTIRFLGEYRRPRSGSNTWHAARIDLAVALDWAGDRSGAVAAAEGSIDWLIGHAGRIGDLELDFYRTMMGRSCRACVELVGGPRSLELESLARSLSGAVRFDPIWYAAAPALAPGDVLGPGADPAMIRRLVSVWLLDVRETVAARSVGIQRDPPRPPVVERDFSDAELKAEWNDTERYAAELLSGERIEGPDGPLLAELIRVGAHRLRDDGGGAA